MGTRMMTLLLRLVLTVTCAVTLTACGGSDENTTKDTGPAQDVSLDATADARTIDDTGQGRVADEKNPIDVMATPDITDASATADDVPVDLGSDEDFTLITDVALPDLTDTAEATDVLQPDSAADPEIVLPDLPGIQDAELEDTIAQDSAEEEVGSADVVASVDLKPEIPPGEQQNPRAMMSTDVIRKGKYEAHLQVTCVTENGFGEKIEDPGIYELSVSALDVEYDELGMLFPTPGTYTVSCKDDMNGLEATAEFIVAHEVVSPGLATVSTELGSQGKLVQQALAAAKIDDLDAIQGAIDGLKASRNTVEWVEPGATLVPPGGWPKLADVQAKVEAAADDPAYKQAVTDLAAAAQELTAATQSLKAAPSIDTLGALEAASQQVNTLIAQAAALEPGGVGLFQSKEAWDAVTESVRTSQDLYVALVEDMLANPGDYGGDPCPNCFTLTEVMISVGIQYILSTIPTYQGMLKEAAKAAASMAVMLALSDAINASLSDGPHPEIQYNMPGYGNAVNDGSALSLLVTGFDPYAGNNKVIFIGPAVGDTVVNVVDLAMGTISALKSLGNWDNAWELGGAIVEAFNQMSDDLGFMAGDIPNLLKTGVVTMPVLSIEPFFEPGGGMWDYIVNLPPLPEVNDGWMPKIGLLIPVSFTNGNGPTYELVILP